MRYLSIEKASINNGLGIRCVLWVSGCTHHCNGCHNTCSWDCNNGLLFTDKEKLKILSYLEFPYVDGITFSGGDPMSTFNRDCILAFADEIKSKLPDKNIWLYTGYTIDELLSDNVDLHNIDYLVDGEYVDSLRDLTLEFRGSSNQHIWKNVNGTWELFR